MSDEFERPSRSQLKREMNDLQKMGDRLVALGPERIKKADMPEELREAILFAQTLKKHEAKRRQSQYIGKVMRTIDLEPVRLMLDAIDNNHACATAAFHHVERWRDRIVDGDDGTVSEMFERFPDIDGQHFRQLVRNARLEKAKGKPPKSSRALFRMLKELQDACEPDDQPLDSTGQVLK